MHPISPLRWQLSAAFLSALAILSSLISSGKGAAQEPRDEALRQERLKIAGTWRIIDLEVEGRRAMEEDIRKLSVVNGTDGTWSLRIDGREIANGNSTFDPLASPKTIDFTPIAGEKKGELYLGIYELGPRVRRLCFSNPGKPRPDGFATRLGDGRFLVTLERLENPE